ncbi:hypothetical protein I79_016061 [Cricetulus griseus]|uniref:Uncharacterized protein n=1 Tax=Cricetulus griseus TaxID=10029 RepID=G3HYD6_CRIGR|nr:hypothetical protein I79_016061 [Cricetulus griseus]
MGPKRREARTDPETERSSGDPGPEPSRRAAGMGAAGIGPNSRGQARVRGGQTHRT